MFMIFCFRKWNFSISMTANSGNRSTHWLPITPISVIANNTDQYYLKWRWLQKKSIENILNQIPIKILHYPNSPWIFSVWTPVDSFFLACYYFSAYFKNINWHVGKDKLLWSFSVLPVYGIITKYVIFCQFHSELVSKWAIRKPPKNTRSWSWKKVFTHIFVNLEPAFNPYLPKNFTGIEFWQHWW